MPRIKRTVLLLGTTAALAVGARAADRPNFLWITCEDTGPHLGCYGDTLARTPQIDAFATTAMRYTNAFACTGVCSASRSALITGVNPSRLGSGGMRATKRLTAAVKCFTDYLRAGGYYCSNNVKTDYNFPAPPSPWDDSNRTAHWRKRTAGQPYFSVANLKDAAHPDAAEYVRRMVEYMPARLSE